MKTYTVIIITKDDIITTQISATSINQASVLSIKKFERMYGDAEEEIQELIIKED